MIQINSGEEDKTYEKKRSIWNVFYRFYLKAVEFTGYLHSNIRQFPALKQMNQDVKWEVKMFQHFYMKY